MSPTGPTHFSRPALDNKFVVTLERLINENVKTQTDIAEEIGYDNPNMITVFKTGKSRVPMDKVLPLSEALDADGAMMLKLWFETYMPGALSAIEQVWGTMAVTGCEKNWLRGLRCRFGEDLPIFSPELVLAPPHAE